MAHVRSFPPIAGASARTLILGTMPGAASLRAGQYYAHPRNAFWAILANLFDFDLQLDYATRTRRVADAGVAVWDVLRSCKRRGSLDANIESASVVPNDFDRFFVSHPRIECVCFNGATAEALYRRHVLQTLVDDRPRTYVRLPSTSPANASVSRSEKTRAWQRCYPTTRRAS